MNILPTIKKLQAHQARMGGVFALTDLKNLIAAKSPLAFHRFIKALQKNEVLFRFTRGLYVIPPFDLEVVSQRLCEKSYISMGTVLAKHLIIGTVPKQTIFAVKTGKNRKYQCELGMVIHVGIAQHLFFGFQKIKGINVADPEKAFLDTLYFYQKGQKPHFNVYADMSVDLLDRKKVMLYLRSYRNERFISFVKGILNARN